VKTTIGVCAVLRNESANLPRFFGVMEQLEASAHVVYSFYENDSADSSSLCLLNWLQGRDYSFLSETLGLPHWRNQERQRTQLLATARNAALRRVLQRATGYLLIIDLDLIFSVDDCLALLQALLACPSAVMACASSVQPLEAIDTGDAWSYYDSWALIDRFGRQGLSGLAVPFLDIDDRCIWQQGGAVDVYSAFGGMAIVYTEVIRKYAVAWEGSRGCEHWAFCEKVRQAGSIIAVPSVQPRVVTESRDLALRPQYVEGLRDLLREHGISVVGDAAS
jgi:hypothetical protein